MQPEPTPGRGGRWRLALLGQFVFVFAAVALAGPGRIDIIDGQPRYEAARGLVEHGDPAVGNPDVWFLVLPGRGGRAYTTYRFPQTAAGVVAILLADATGPAGEARRQFFFSLIGAAAAGALVTAYALWFRRLGHRPAAAVGWALAGLFCTPSCFYATSSFDDILGTAAVVVAVCLAWYGRQGRPRLFAALAGLAVGLAFNCKQPLGLFVLPVLALTWQRGLPRREQWARLGLVLAGLTVGLAAYEGYEWYKFPPGTTDAHAALLARYVPPFPGTPVAACLSFLVSPGAGIPWFCPTIFLSLYGAARWARQRPLFTASTLLACAGFFAFICALIPFKGDLCWGPRYLTPVLAVLWVFVPAAAAELPRRLVGLLLGLGVLVQLLALSTDFHRMYVELRFPSGFYQGHPWIYFYPQASHLVHRPREIRELLTEDHSATEAFSPEPVPTMAPPCPEFMERGPAAVRKYRYLDSFRPWWASMTFEPPDRRPVDLGETAALLLALAAGGLALLGTGLGGPGHPHLPHLFRQASFTAARSSGDRRARQQ